MLSVEVAYSSGNLCLRVHRHDINITLVKYDQESSADRSRPLEIRFAEGFGFRINGVEDFIDGDNAVFFSNLSNVQAWYGGVLEDELQRLVRPRTLEDMYGSREPQSSNW